jgi:PKD repeat protein
MTYAGAVIVVIIIIIAGVAAYQFLYTDDGEDEQNGGPGTNGNQKPRAVITTNWTADARVGDLLEFNATQSSDKDGRIILYDWDFDDGKTMVGADFEVVNHSFSYAGEFMVNLTVRDDGGEVDYATKKIIIRQSDFQDTFFAQLSTNDLLPMIPANETFEFPVEEDATRANVTFTLIGGSGSSDDNFISNVDILILNSFFIPLDNISEEVRGIANVSFEFYSDELSTPGNYQIQVNCRTGSVNVEAEVRVFY